MLWSDAIKASIQGDCLTEINNALGAFAVIEFWTGAIPTLTTDPDAGVMVATCSMSSTPFGALVSGTTTANAIAPDTSTVAGTVQYWRMKDGSGTTVFQGTCGTSSADMIFDSVTFNNGDTLTITSVTVTISVTP